MYLIIVFQTLRWLPRPTPSEEAPVGGVCSSMETMMLEGKTAHHGGDVCVMCVSLAKSLPREREFFVHAGTHLAVKLLSC
jgi:hypothetical protein